jgi:hypothetical protein
MGTVEDAVIVGRLDVDAVSVPMSAVHKLLEVFILKISTSLPSGPGAQP